MKTNLLPILFLLPLLSGCFEDEVHADCWREADIPTDGPPSASARHDFSANTKTAYADMGFDGTTWPDLKGHTITIIDHGAFQGYAFEPAKEAFEQLTNATVLAIAADDAGSALQQAIQDRKTGGGSFDVLYGVDNVLMHQAVEADLFDPYTPLLGSRVQADYRFVPIQGGAWVATPVDVGFIAVNADIREDVALRTWNDLAAQASDFVTEDPRFSSPGLGFLVATVAAFGEDCYLGFWQELFDNDVLITSGWSEAYAQHFTGGFGQWEANPLDRSIVTSYTSSPAYEMYYGYDKQNLVLTAPQSTFQQIQTMGILHGADRAAAEAWIEFTLTDAFQSLEAPWNAIYPVVSTPAVDASVRDVYAGIAPEPGSFTPAHLDSQTIGQNVERWVGAWTDLYEQHQA